MFNLFFTCELKLSSQSKQSNMKALVINSKSEYQVIAKRIEEIKDAPVNSPEADELKIITKAIVEYEKRILRNASVVHAETSSRIIR